MTDKPRKVRSQNPMLDLLKRKQLTGKAYKHAPKQERKLAEKVHAWRVPGSGAGKQKGDVRATGLARIECKATQRKSFSITREMLDKISDAAGATGEIPIVQVDFLDDKGAISDRVAVVPLYVLERLISEAEE